MRRMLSCVCMSFGCLLGADVSAHGPEDVPAVLVYSRTAGFRHASIPEGIEAIRRIGDASGFVVEATEDPAWFTDERLAKYDAVVFLSTTGDVLDEAGERAFERYIRGGGGYAGIHAAADTEYDWPWYGQLVGAYFKTHPRIQDATVLVADRSHPSTAHLPSRWDRRDEWYVYRDSPRGRVHVLASLDERTYQGGGMNHDHPIAWCHEFEGGRAWYTGGGHTKESFVEPAFVEHIRGGILWAMGPSGAERGDWGATIWSNYDKTVLDADVTDPMELAVTENGRVIFVERGGTVKVHHPAVAGRGGITTIAGFIDVFDELEDGLLGVALDPAFSMNQWIYFFYSPAGETAENIVSRFKMVGDELLAGSEDVLLRIPTQRDECCHSGGSLAFGPDGCLYISTGDNTNPFASDGYAPIDEREGRKPWDAQRSSANTQDLRGKVLRIRPTRNGSYEIPDGNLFTGELAGQGRPEIYAMGCRNPFRISVDPETGWLYWGDVGPDASDPNPARGPAGHDEWNRAQSAGFFGWPYFVADNQAYRDYDFATGESGEPFDAASPRNTSVNNYGAERLPPARPAWIHYPYGTSETFPEVGEGGRCAMAGPAIRGLAPGEREGMAESALPAYFDDTVLIYEWTRNWIKEVKLDSDGEILGIWDFLPNMGFSRPMDLELGPDGRLYMIEWGSGFGGGNDNAQIVRIDYYGTGLRPPKASARASAVDGRVPLRVSFTAEGSESRNAGAQLSFEWDFDGDSIIDAEGTSPTFTYEEPGDYFARVLVSDGLGQSASAGVAISAGNSAPTLEVVWPPHGGFLALGESVDFEMRASDAEDDAGAGIDPERASAQILLGHDTHAHPLHRARGLSGRLESLRDDGHGGDADVFTVLELAYRDGGAPYVTPLTARERVILQPKRKQAQFCTSVSGVQIEKVSDPLGGGSSVAFIEDGDWISFSPVNLTGIKAMAFRVASATDGGRIEARLDSVDGPLLTAVEVPGTGGWQEWTDVVCEIEDPGGTRELYLVFRDSDSGGDGYLFNLNWIDFMGRGVAAN